MVEVEEGKVVDVMEEKVGVLNKTKVVEVTEKETEEVKVVVEKEAERKHG